MALKVAPVSASWNLFVKRSRILLPAGSLSLPATAASVALSSVGASF